MNFSWKIFLMIIKSASKKQRFILSPKNRVLEKPQGGGTLSQPILLIDKDGNQVHSTTQQKYLRASQFKLLSQFRQTIIFWIKYSCTQITDALNTYFKTAVHSLKINEYTFIWKETAGFIDMVDVLIKRYECDTCIITIHFKFLRQLTKK